MAKIKQIQVGSTTYDITSDDIPTKTSDLTNDSGFKKVTVDASEPSSPSEGDIWIDTSDNGRDSLINLIYPVGSIYISVNSSNPSTLFGGTWVAFGQGRTLLGMGSNYTTVEATGGAETHKHSLATGFAQLGHYANRLLFNATTRSIAVNKDFYGTSTTDITTYLNEAVKLDGDSDNASSMQPYITTYMWKRTA